MTPKLGAIRRADMLTAAYLAVAAGALVLLSPALLNARTQLGFPTISYVTGLPVAVHGFYFFTFLALGISGVAAHSRGARPASAAILAVAGLGGFEALYAVTYSVSTSQGSLLIPRWGLPTEGWMGFGTWLVVELVVASFGLVSWDRSGVDKELITAGTIFLLGLVIWDVSLGWNYPPYDNSLAVFLVNTVTEVFGSLLVPLAFTSRSDDGLEFLERIRYQILGRHLGPTYSG
jgi:hypothetical protein